MMLAAGVLVAGGVRDLAASPLGPIWLGVVRFVAPLAILLVLFQGLVLI